MSFVFERKEISGLGMYFVAFTNSSLDLGESKWRGEWGAAQMHELSTAVADRMSSSLQSYHVDAAVHDHGAARMSFLKERKRQASAHRQECLKDPQCEDLFHRDNEGFVACQDGWYNVHTYKNLKKENRHSRNRSCSILASSGSTPKLCILIIAAGFVNELPCEAVDQMSFINFATLSGNDPNAYETSSSSVRFHLHVLHLGLLMSQRRCYFASFLAFLGKSACRGCFAIFFEVYEGQ